MYLYNWIYKVIILLFSKNRVNLKLLGKWTQKKKIVIKSLRMLSSQIQDC